MKKEHFTVMHLTEGSRWAGMETYLYYLLPTLSKYNNINIQFTAFHEGQITKRLREKGIQTRCLQRRKKFDVRMFFALVRLLKELDVDVIHMHGYLAIIYGILAALFARVPIKVVTLHASPLVSGKGIGSFLLRIYLYIAFTLIKWTSTHCIAVSEDLSNTHKKFKKINSNKLRVIHNGINIEETRSQARNKEFAKTCPIIGIVGRIDKNKGQIYFLKAAENLIAQNYKYKFWIFGAGPLEESLKNYCSNKNLTPHVKFHGFKNDILKYLSQLDVLIISSFHEGIPYTLLESMALEVPVVATAVGGIPEVITDSVNGFLIPIQQPDEIVARIKKILEDAELKESLTKTALQILHERFSDVVMARAVYTAYCDYLNLKT